MQAEDNTPHRHDLSRVAVRLISPDEQPHWDALMERHHYLGFRQFAGCRLRYVAHIDGRWLALIGWQSAALRCTARDQWIGWSSVLRTQRLHLIANNARFLILPQARQPNLASRVLSLNLQRLDGDWRHTFGHPLLMAETFVDVSRFSGICYRAANWRMAGLTRGFSRQTCGYQRHDQPKQVWLYPLHRRACALLAQPAIHPSWSKPMQKAQLTPSQWDSLYARLRALPEHRKPRGLRHPLDSSLTIAIAAVIAGANSYLAIAEWAARLTQAQLKRVRARFNRQRQRFVPPSEPTLRRVLQQVDSQAVDQVLCNWLAETTDTDEPIAVDGKTLKGAYRSDGSQVHLLSAFLSGQGITVAQQEIDAKTNEIPELPRLLEPLDLEARVVSADALHTQRETARYLVEEKKAHYLFTVKANQPTLLDDLQSFTWNHSPLSRSNPR